MRWFKLLQGWDSSAYLVCNTWKPATSPRCRSIRHLLPPYQYYTRHLHHDISNRRLLRTPDLQIRTFHPGKSSSPASNNSIFDGSILHRFPPLSNHHSPTQHSPALPFPYFGDSNRYRPRYPRCRNSSPPETGVFAYHSAETNGGCESFN